MIVTITPNPSVDISYFLSKFELGQAHRIDKEVKDPGGKGINVAKVAHILGSKLATTGFLGGSSGKFISNALKEMKLDARFIEIDGETRSSIAINDGTKTTELREKGPFIDEDSLEEFFKLVENLKSESDIFSCSGSLPLGLDVNFYDKLMEILADKKFILDTSEAGLKHVVFESKHKPYAIKPNIDEIRQLVGDKVDNISYIEILKLEELSSIPVVIISLGKDGCVARFEDKFYEAKVPVIQAVNPVGSGDSSIAGLLYGLEKELSNEEILKSSMACGVLNTLEEKIGHINIDKFEETKDKIVVKELW